MSKLPKWYDRIEEPFPELVHTLRNSGFNTTCSCGHYPRPYIQMEWFQEEELENLWVLLTDKGYINWSIHAHWDADGRRSLEITFYEGAAWNDREGLASLKDILCIPLDRV